MWLGAATAGVVALSMLLLVSRADGTGAASASITCDAEQITFGDDVGCKVVAADGALVDWGDGTVEPAADATTHAIQAVGPVTVAVVAANGAVLATHDLAIAPDLAVECEYGDPKPIYELAPARQGAIQPYDYVFRLADGTKVAPGDADYPADVHARLELELAVVGEEPIVGLCTATSHAVDALGGHVTYFVDDGWNPVTTIRTRKATPGTRGRWDGVQPLDVTIVAEAAGFEASEQIGVFWGGCG